MATSRPYDDNINEGVLAKSLANNHAYSTLDSEDRRAHKRILKERSLIPNYDRRVIVIVGSGASQDAGVPGTNEAISRLEKPAPRLDRPVPQLYESDPRPDKRLPLVDGPPLPLAVIEKELDRLESVQKLDRSQFETRLLAMSATEYSGKVVRERLVKIFNCRFMPTLSYELLAHLLKHKFIDAIISFNFDELLDQAISDELKSEEYHLILSDGDCPSSVNRNGVLEKPFYIKPHGTVSHLSTLRFTRDDYYRLPLGIQRVILELLSGRPVDLISIGFNMKSFEFNLIASRAQAGSRIFYVNLETPKPEPELGDRFKSHWIPVDRKTRSLGEVLKSICGKTSKHFRAPYGPRSIERHQLLSNLFEGESWETREENGYLWDRTVVELALAIAKAKGFVMMSGLSAGRAGEYFRQHQNSVALTRAVSGQPAPKREKSFIDLCAALGLRDVAYGHEALRLTKNDLRPVIIPRGKFEAKKQHSLFKAVRSELTPARRGVFDAQKSLFKTTLLSHYDGAEVEVRAKSAILHDNLFKTAKVLRSKTALNCYTVEMLEKRSWQHLLLVSETGEWLESEGVEAAIDIKRHPKRQIFLIVADRSHEAELLKRYPGRIRIEEMFWWDHNRHLTLFLDRAGKELESIYFTRQRRSTDIVPVRLNASDSRIVFEFWKAYWIRATEQKGAFVNRDTIEAFEFPTIPPTP